MCCHADHPEAVTTCGRDSEKTGHGLRTVLLPDACSDGDGGRAMPDLCFTAGGSIAVFLNDCYEEAAKVPCKLAWQTLTGELLSTNCLRTPKKHTYSSLYG